MDNTIKNKVTEIVDEDGFVNYQERTRRLFRMSGLFHSFQIQYTGERIKSSSKERLILYTMSCNMTVLLCLNNGCDILPLKLTIR